MYVNTAAIPEGKPVTSPHVGFIGLGHIGGPMARRVAGIFDLVAYDRDPRVGADLPESAQRATDLVEVACEADIVCLSLPVGGACAEVIRGLAAVPEMRTSLVVDLSTIGPSWAERCAKQAADQGLRYLDAPVSGGQRGALAGKLSVMVAGDADDLEAARPILDTIAHEVFVVGDRPGLGQAMKLTNNAIALAVVPLTSEALAFGASFGLEPKAMIEVINASSGRTQRSEGMFPTSILTGRFDHGAEGEITAKDMDLYVEEAQRVGGPIDIASVVAGLYRAFVVAHPHTDYSYLHEFIAGNNRTDA